MISLHYWNHDSIFCQFDFENRQELVSWLVENLVVFSNKYSEYHRNLENESRKEAFELELQDAEDDQEIDLVLEKWQSLCNNDFLKIDKIFKLLKNKSMMYYVNDKFAYEYLSLHKF